jgi:long-chain acyl-CoA synthetase
MSSAQKIPDAAIMGRSPNSTVPKVFWDYCQEDPQRTAVIELGARVWSRGELGDLSVRIRDYLAARGLNQHATVAIVCPNCAEFVAAYLGITLLGATALPINFHLTAEEVEHVLRTSCALWVIVHPSMHAKVLQLVGSYGAKAPGVVNTDQLLAAPSGRVQSGVAQLPAKLGRTMLFTSGTTGKPKAITYSRDSGHLWLEKLIAFREARGTFRDSAGVHFCASVLFHAGPLEGAVVTLHMGNTIVITRRWEANAALSAITEYRVTECFVVPMMLVQLARLSEAERACYDVSSLRMLIHAGAPCPPEAKRRMIEWLGPIVCEGYGASEGGGTFVTSEEWLRYPGTVGRPIPGATISIRERTGKPVPTGQPGLVYIRPYTQDRFAYAGDPVATASCYIGDEFTVGDIGYLNPEGYLFLLDRSEHLIICGGVNIYPAEIEAVLAAHPQIADCAVVGKPDPEFGETVHAFIQPLPSLPVTLPELRSDIVKFACRRLAAAKIPRSLEFVAAIPRNPNGKLMKRMLPDPTARCT